MEQGQTMVKCDACGTMCKSTIDFDGLCFGCQEAEGVIHLGEGYNCKGNCEATTCKLHNKSNKCLATFGGWCKECLCIYGCNI